MTSIILTNDFEGNEAGILGFHNGEDFELDTGKKFNQIPNDYYEELTNENAIFLKEFSVQKRLRKHKKNDFSFLLHLKKGDKCILKKTDEICTVLKGINKNSMEFKIRLKNGSNIQVDISQIKRIKSKREVLLEAGHSFRRGWSTISKRVPQGNFFKNLKVFHSLSSSSKENLEYTRSYGLSITDPSIILVDWKYVDIKSNMSTLSLIDSKDEFKINDLVEIDDRIDLFGRIAFILTNKDESFFAISENENIINKLTDHIDKILFTENCLSVPFNGIIVHPIYIKKFDYPLDKKKSQLFLNPDSFKVTEKLPFDEFPENSIVKFNFSLMENFYGNVEENFLINNETCLKINLILDGRQIQKTEFIKSADVKKVDRIMEELEFFDGVVITTKNIVTVEEWISNAWNKEDEVEFSLRTSGETYNGILLSTIKINDLPSAAVHVTTAIDRNKKILSHKCRQQFLIQLDCGIYDNVFIVPLSLVHKEKSKELLAVISHILEHEDNWSETIIAEAMAMRNESILSYLIAKIKTEVDLEKTPELLSLLFDRNDIATLKILLIKSKFGPKSDLTLLKLGLKCLNLDDYGLFEEIIEKCIDRDILLDNKETFLTNLFINCDITEETIINIIRSNKFSVAKCNDAGQSPIELACENLWKETIVALLTTSKIDQNQLKKANEIIDNNCFEATQEEIVKRFDIGKLLRSYMDENIMCCICKNAHRDIAFDCGHTFCEECSNKITVCAICKREPEKRIKIYL